MPSGDLLLQSFASRDLSAVSLCAGSKINGRWSRIQLPASSTRVSQVAMIAVDPTHSLLLVCAGVSPPWSLSRPPKLCGAIWRFELHLQDDPGVKGGLVHTWLLGINMFELYDNCRAAKSSHRREQRTTLLHPLVLACGLGSMRGFATVAQTRHSQCQQCHPFRYV